MLPAALRRAKRADRFGFGITLACGKCQPSPKLDQAARNAPIILASA